MFNNVVSKPVNFAELFLDCDKIMTLSENELLKIVDKGSVPDFVEYLTAIEVNDISKVVCFMCKRIIAEGSKAFIRADRLKQMFQLLVKDPRFSKEIIDNFFKNCSIQDSFTSFKAVMFWKYLNKLIPTSLSNHYFFLFLLHTSSKGCDQTELEKVEKCVSKLLNIIHLNQVKDLLLCVHHKFFPLIYDRWENPPNDKLLLECSNKEGEFYVDNLKFILRNSKTQVLSGFFNRALQNHCFSVAIAVLEVQRFKTFKLKRTLHLNKICKEDIDSDDINETRLKLIEKIQTAHLPFKVKFFYCNVLEQCGQDFTDLDDVLSSTSCEEITNKKARKEGNNAY